MAAIDCHALVYAADTARYPLAPDAPPSQPAELETCTEAAALGAALDAGALTGAVLVQRNRFHGFNNALICDLAAHDARLRAIVSVDSRTPDAAAHARRLLALPNVSGLRLMEPEKGAGLDWLDGAHARAVWAAAADSGALVDVHVFPWNRDAGLAVLTGLVRDFPGLRVLVDNLGNGPIEDGAPDFGLDHTVIDLAQVTLKFSEMTLGRIERAGLAAADVLSAVVARVGAERLVWGSDLLPPQRSLAEAAARAAAALPVTQRDAVLTGNAARLFGFA
jgi:predicted TIM-barrel fold metal-dependent hydrolase